jgi:hypothetical protein
MATRNEEELAKLLASVETEQAGLQALLERLGKAPSGGLTSPDEITEPVKDSGVKPGDLFELGGTGSSVAIAPSRRTSIGCSMARSRSCS